MSDVVEQFADLFAGRTDAIGTEEGGCVRKDVTIEDYERHLTTGPAIGIYPLTIGGPERSAWVKWGCSDIDMPKLGLDPDDPTLAKNLRKVLGHLGLVAWIERSRSKGYHVWVFAEDWVPAEDMRNALLVAHEVADIPPAEVNPKQVSGVELGNYVRLPYPRGLPFRRQAVLDPVPLFVGAQQPLSLDEFVVRAHKLGRNAPAEIAQVAKLYVPPPPKRTVNIDPSASLMTPAVDRLNGLAHTIWKEGPTERFGYDRSRTLQRLAHLCRESGLSPSEAFGVVSDADMRWGKFYARGDGEEQVKKMIEHAYS